ncbi:MAG: helix-turn-helix transcriptional regulator [Lachnospiraceae bacterium]|nr:helix-turn-helix transcriptional regulator [Lachnospiraceae bacterium]
MDELNFQLIGEKIRERRTALNMKQDYLADKLNVNPSHISNIECGRAHPSLCILIRIANLLRCSVDYFIFNEYTYQKEASSSVDHAILSRLQYKDNATKEKILKIIDIL